MHSFILWKSGGSSLSIWVGRRPVFNPGSGSQSWRVGSQDSNTRLTPKLVLFLLRVPTNHFLLKGSHCLTVPVVQPSGVSGKAGFSCKASTCNSPRPTHTPLFLYLLFWPDCTEAGNVILKQTELGRQRPAAFRILLVGNVLTWFLFVLTFKKSTQIKQLNKKCSLPDNLYSGSELLWNSAS